MPENESEELEARTVCCFASKSNQKEKICQSIWGLNFANQYMPKITGWLYLGNTRNLTATGVFPGVNYTKNSNLLGNNTRFVSKFDL